MARSFFSLLIQNTISMIGTTIAIAALTLMISLFVLEALGYEGGPYLGILTYLILPGLFLTGLLLIPVGILLQRRRAAKAAAHGEAPPLFPVIDLNKERTRKLVVIFLALTVLNVVVLAGATYKGIEVMDSTEFCGLACHSVMQPEYTAHQRSPHARVGCVDCHIGPGADWFVKSKLDGAWQLVAVALDIYPRPIPTPLHDLRPARDTCEQCHWPTNYVGDRIRIDTVFADDEANTELKTALLLKVGGLRGRESSGIHWHVDPNVEIRYRSDESRMNIYEVELTQADGTVKRFEPRNMPDEAERGGWRVMDCVDCHNRPTHIYRSADEEVDRLLAKELMDSSLPYIKREGVRILEEADYPSHEAARAGIAQAVEAFYRENYPEVLEGRAESVAAAGHALGDAYSWNIFPHMKVGWNTYPDHRGHPPIASREEAPGCFRCHNRNHRTADREFISRDCSLCHTVLADREENPEILRLMDP
jgi:hypothetical protein